MLFRNINFIKASARIVDLRSLGNVVHSNIGISANFQEGR